MLEGDQDLYTIQHVFLMTDMPKVDWIENAICLKTVHDPYGD